MSFTGWLRLDGGGLDHKGPELTVVKQIRTNRPVGDAWMMQILTVGAFWNRAWRHVSGFEGDVICCRCGMAVDDGHHCFYLCAGNNRIGDVCEDAPIHKT